MASNPVSPSLSQNNVPAVQRWRARTNYAPKRFTGFAPITHAMIAEIGRLSSGQACNQLLYVILDAALGRIVKPTEAFEETTQEMRTPDLAELCCCDQRTIQRELLSLTQRKIIKCVSPRKGQYIITPLFRTWHTLPNYQAGPALEPEIESAEPETPEIERAKTSATVLKLTEEPVPVRAGGTSRRIRVDCGISEVRCKSNVDIHFEAVVQGGSLLLSLMGQRPGRLGSVKRGNEINELDSRTRHPAPSWVEHQKADYQHPRAKELTDLFDELLLRAEKGGRRSLSGDSQCLRQACEALGDVPKDYLSHYVMVRAKREISSPKAAVGICRDAARDWLKAKDLPPAKRNPRNVTQEDMDAIIAEERAREAKRRRA